MTASWVSLSSDRSSTHGFHPFHPEGPDLSDRSHSTWPTDCVQPLGWSLGEVRHRRARRALERSTNGLNGCYELIHDGYKPGAPREPWFRQNRTLLPEEERRERVMHPPEKVRPKKGKEKKRKGDGNWFQDTKKHPKRESDENYPWRSTHGGNWWARERV